MLENSALNSSRFLFVTMLVCAAVMSLIVCSRAAGASPTTTQVDGEVKYKVLRRPYAPLHRLLFPETGLQTGTNGETDMRRNYGEASSIIDYKSPPLTGSGYKQHSPDRGESRAVGGGRPASSSQALSGNSYNSAIVRKSSRKEAASQSSSPPQVWDARRPYIKEKLPESQSHFSAQTGRYWSTSLPTSMGHSSGYKETNELAAAGPPSTSSGIQSSKFLSFASQTVPHAPSISDGFDASVIKSIPSLERLTSSITDFSQGLHSVTPQVHSYLFKDSQTSHGGHETSHTVAGGGATGFPTAPQKQLSHRRKNPNKDVTYLSVNGNNAAQYGSPRDSFIKYQRTSPAPATRRSFVPSPEADLQGSYSTNREKSAISSFINATTRGSVHAHKPAGAVKSIYGLRGFENPAWRAENSPRFRGNLYSSMSSKYSFGQRKAPTTPAKLMRTPTGYSSPSPGTLIQANYTPRPGREEGRPLLPESDAGMDRSPERRQFRVFKRIYGSRGFRPHEGAKTLVKEQDDSARVQPGFEGFKLGNTQARNSRIHRWNDQIHGAETDSSHVSTVRKNELRSEEFKPHLERTGNDKYKKRHKMYTFLGFQPVRNKIGNPLLKDKQQHPTTAPSSQTISSAHLISTEKPPVPPSPESGSSTLNRTGPAAMKASLLSSATSSTVRGTRVKGISKKPHQSSVFINKTRSPAIVRLPRKPARVVAITYADILGSASFSGVAATTQTPVTPADKGYSPNTTATTRKEEEAGSWSLNSTEVSRDNASKRPEAQVDEELDLSRGEGNESSVAEDDRDVKTSDFFPENEGSGSGGFNTSEVFLSKKSQGLSEDLLEIDDLRVSAGNVTFESMTHGEE